MSPASIHTQGSSSSVARWILPFRIGLLLFLLGFPLWVASTTPPDLHDDAYITLNYAKSLFTDGSFTFNSDTPTLGTTTPLFTFVMAGLHGLLPELRMDLLAIYFSALCCSAMVLLLVLYRRPWQLEIGEAYAVAATLVLFSTYFSLGMEANLFALLFLLVCTLVLDGRYLAGGIATGLLFLTRGEGILMAVAVPIWLTGQFRHHPLRVVRPLAYMALGGLLVVMPWVIYAWLNFGVILPDTLSAKIAQGALGMPSFGARTVERLGRWGSYLPRLQHLTWLYHFVALAGVWRILRIRRAFLLPLVWTVIYLATYTTLGIPYYWWYNIPPYNMWLLCIGVALGWAFIGSATPMRNVARACALVLLACMTAQSVHLARSNTGYPKAAVYLAVTDWLREYADPDDLIATAEVGYPGFYLGNPILDLWGLTTPEVIPEIKAMRFDTAFWNTPPAFYVGLENDPPWDALQKSERFEANYEAVETRAAPAPWHRCTIYAQNSNNDSEGIGRWHRARRSSALTEDQLAEFEALDAIGYLAGSVAPTSVGGVIAHDDTRAWQGLNLYTSGDAPEAVLMDMDGNTLHSWTYAWDDAWREPDFPMRINHPGMPFWRRAYPAEDGGLYAIFEGLGLLKVDRDAELIWFHLNRAHHDLAFYDDGRMLSLTYEANLIPRLHPDKLIRHDFIATLDTDGSEIDRVSLLRCFENSDYMDIVNERPLPAGDIFHTNSLYIIRGDEGVTHPAFTAGRVIISIFYLDTIAVIDLDDERVVWAQRGPFKYQHDAQLLDTGTLLLFDNAGRDGKSRVMEFQPEDMSLLWSYPEEDQLLHSPTCSTTQRLPNGNTLITESDNGRALEVTPSGETVWEFHNPQHAGENNEYVATLFDLHRFSIEEVKEWFGGELPQPSPSAPAMP